MPTFARIQFRLLACLLLGLFVVPFTHAQAPPEEPGSAAVIKPVIEYRGSSPPRPVAGGVFRLMYFILRSDGNGAFQTAAPNMVVTVKTTIAGKIVPRRVGVFQGPTTVVMNIPPSAKGKQLKVTLTVRGGGEMATMTRTFRVL